MRRPTAVHGNDGPGPPAAPRRCPRGCWRRVCEEALRACELCSLAVGTCLEAQILSNEGRCRFIVNVWNRACCVGPSAIGAFQEYDDSCRAGAVCLICSHSSFSSDLAPLTWKDGQMSVLDPWQAGDDRGERRCGILWGIGLGQRLLSDVNGPTALLGNN